MVAQRLDDVALADGVLVPGAGGPVGPLEPLLDRGEVGEHQLGGDDLDVARGVDRAADVDDVVVLEAAHDVADRVDLADVGQELVAETLTLATRRRRARRCRRTRSRSARPSCDAASSASRVSRASGTGDDADVRVDGAEREVRRLGAGLGHGVEQRRLADVRQSDETDLQRHGEPRGRASGGGGDDRRVRGRPASVAAATRLRTRASAPPASGTSSLDARRARVLVASAPVRTTSEEVRRASRRRPLLGHLRRVGCRPR